MKFQRNAKEKKNINGGISDTTAKILSVIAAIILWFYVIDVQTTQYEKEFNAVPIAIENLNPDTNLSVISGRDSTVDVTLKGTRAKLNTIKKSDIYASIDASQIREPGNFRFDITIDVPSGISVSNQSVSLVSLSIDRTMTKPFKIEVETEKNLFSGYELGEFVIDPSYVNISGPEDIIKTIQTAKIKVNLGDAKGSVTSTREIQLLNASGQQVSSPYLMKSEEYAEVTIPVLKTESKEISVVFDGNGKFKYSVLPKSVLIKGRAEFVDNMDKVTTIPVVLDDNTVSATAMLDLPSGVVAFDKDGNVINSITISSIERIDGKDGNE